MEKIGTVGSKKTLDDSPSSEKGVAIGDGEEPKKELTVQKSEKEESVKNEGTPGNQKKDRNSSSTTSKAPSRSTRSSNNPEFVAKQRHFLQKVSQGVFYQSSEEESDYSVINGQSHTSKRKRSVSGGLAHSESSAVVKGTSIVDPAGSNSSYTSPSSSISGSKGSSAVKKRKYEVDELTRDIYCWVCHREMGISSGGSTLSCEVCPRVYHARCCHSMDPGSPCASSPSNSSNSGNSPAPPKKGWACPECVKIVRAETMGTRSRAMQLITMDQLCTLLKFVLTRVRAVTGAEPFYGAVDLQQFPRYREFVANPMDLGLIDRNIRRRTYGSTEAFFADMKWLVHNSIIFNTQHSKLTSIARSMLKICRQELLEIENCPDCYSNAHTRKDNWFIDVCRRPHILVWAKLKGFPHWPAKAMRINKESCVDVRFFGAHDRAWVPARDCFLYSREMPAPPKNRKKNNFDGCIMEVEDHIKKLKDRFGVFMYAPLRTVYDPAQEDEIIMKMLPKFQPINLDNPSSYARENLQDEQVSRESPSMSTGTEEESDRDQSLEEETSQKREYDTSFEDSMEVPSGCDVSQPSKNAQSSTQPTEDLGKVAEETTLESDGVKRTKNETEGKDSKDEMDAEETRIEAESMEARNEIEAKEIKNDVEEGDVNKEMEAKKAKNETEAKETGNEIEAKEMKNDTGVKEVPKFADSDTREDEKEGEETKGNDKGGENEKERGDTGKGVEVATTEGEAKELEVDVGEVEMTSVDVPDQDDIVKVDSSATKETRLEKEVLLNVEAVEKISEDKKAEEESNEGGKEKSGNGEETVEGAKVSSDSEAIVKVEIDEGEGGMIHDKLDDVNDGDTGAEEVEDGRNVADSNVTDGGEIIGEKKETSISPLSLIEEKEENAKSTLKEEENSVEITADISFKVSMDEKCNEMLEKSVTDTDEAKENSASEKMEQGILVKCANENSIGDKLTGLIDQSNESEIDKIINTTCPEDESSESLPSVNSVRKRKASGNKSSEKSCDKAEDDTLERDGDENRAKLFQSLRLVNVETLRHDAKVSVTKKGIMEVDNSNKDNTVGLHGSKFEMQNKIDVNKLRESLMTKCASSAVTGSDLSHTSESAAPKITLNLLTTLPTEVKKEESKDDDHAKTDVDASIEIDSEDVSSDKPAKVSVIVTSPASNKGDVGSQLRVLGKLKQRLSFIKETASESDEESTQEKEDENTVEEADSVTGDASGTSNSDEEDSANQNNCNVEVEKGSVSEDKTAEKGSDGAAEINVQEAKDIDVDDEKVSTLEEKKIDEHVEKNEGKSESVCGSEDKRNEEDCLKRKRRNEGSEKIDVGEVDRGDKCSLDSETKTLDIEPEKPSKSSESVNIEGNSVQGRISSSSWGKPPEINDAGRASPVTSKKLKISGAKDNDSAKARASPLKAKSDEVVEEEVLNREVLKESNMVVVQKTVKTRRLDEEPSGGSAPKRARKGIAQKALIVDRSESPAPDEVFPSMFLDPSVTITVLQEAEKENGGSKEQPSGSTSVEELRTSVNLSNDVSLTMVRATGALEGLAAMQDGAVSRGSEQQDVDILGHNAQNSVSPLATQFRPRARKSFPRPSPRLYARSSQTPNPPPSMEVRRLPNTSRDTSPMNLTAGSSLLKTASSNLVPMPVVASRGASTQPSVPLTTVTLSSSTLSTPSTSQALVRTVVSPGMPSTSVLAANAQSNSASPRPPNLRPRTPTYPLSGSQPLFTPSEAGPVSAEFSKHAHKLSCYMRQAIEDILGDLAKMGNSEAAIKILRVEVEKLRWEHAQEIAELKHNHDLVITEIKNSLEKEKQRVVNDVKRQCEIEKLRAIEETKRKQWCALCSKEALFYCCWNTSYCDYPCQQTHWPRHMASCAQNNGMPESGNGDSNTSGNRKDGSSGRGSAPPPPFHQLQRPGSVPQESHPEEEYYDEDSSSPPTPRTGTSGGTYRVKRRRCGVCKGCLVKDNCGNCAPCRNSKTHQVCRMRRCRSLQSDWPTGGTSRTVSPEPGPVNVPLETPPLTHASKKKRSGQKSPGAPSPPPLGLPNVQQQQRGESLKSPVTHETSAHTSQSSPYGGTVTSKLTSQSQPKGQHQDSALDLPQQQMILPPPPPLLSKPTHPSFPESCAGNEQCLVNPMYIQASPPPLQFKNHKMTSSGNQNAIPNPKSCISQALVPYHMPSEPQIPELPTVPGPKPSRSRKGHPQRSRNHSPPTRSTYLQPPHFIRQQSNNNDKPFNGQVPEISPQPQESQIQPFVPQSFPPMPKHLMPQTEKTEAHYPNFCPPVPLPPNHDVPFTSDPLGSGGGSNFSNIISIAPNPSVVSNPHQMSPQHASSYPEVNSYYSHSLPYHRPSEKVIPEAQKDTSHYEIHNSQAQTSRHHQSQPKRGTDAQKRGSVLPDQFYNSSSGKNSGLSNAVLHLPNSNAAFLGSEAHPINSTQNPENLAALPPNIYPQTTLSHGNAPRSNSQSTHAKPSFLNPHYKAANIPNPPVLPLNYNDIRANRNPQNPISTAHNPIGIGGWASNFPLQAPNPQPPVSDLAVAKFDNDIPKNYSKPPNSMDQLPNFSATPNSMDQLPNFSATFVNYNSKPGSTSQSVLSVQSTGQFAPPKNSRSAGKNTRKRAERCQKEPAKTHNGPLTPQNGPLIPYNGPPTIHNGPITTHNGPPSFEVPPESASAIANFCAQLNSPQIGYSPGHPNIPTHPGPRSHYPENGFLQPGNPFPMPRYSSQGHGGHGSHPQPPAGSQQNHQFGPVRGSCMAILSATSIIMPPPPPNPPNFLFPPPFDMEMLVRQHQLHRHQLATGLNIFTETLRNASDPTRKL